MMTNHFVSTLYSLRSIASMMMLAVIASNAHASVTIIDEAPDPNFQYTYCIPPTRTTTSTTYHRTTSHSHHHYRHHHHKKPHSSYQISVSYVVPYSNCTSCVTWVPARCTCYGECIPAHWEAYRYSAPCHRSQVHTETDMKNERHGSYSRGFTTDPSVTQDISYDMSTADDHDNF